jgi:hypothetical protein
MINITITLNKDSNIEFDSKKFSKLVNDKTISYTFKVDDENKEDTIRMLAESLGVGYHKDSECMNLLYDKIKDKPDEVKDSYNKLIIKLDEHGL